MKPQKGMALIVSLVVLVVAALLGLSSFQSSQLEERMAGNHRFSVSALQAAEAGVNDILTRVLDYTYSPSSPFCDDLGSSMNGYDLVKGYPGMYTREGDFSGGNLTKKFKVVVKCTDSGSAQHVLGYSRGVVLDEVPDDPVDLAARLLRVEIVPPGYDTVKMMLSDKDADFTGHSSVFGSVHSNQNVNISIKDDTGRKSERIVSEGTITAAGEVTINNDSASTDSDCGTSICAQSGAPRVNVPSAQDQIDIAKFDYITTDDAVRDVALVAYDDTVYEPTNPANHPDWNPVLLPPDQQEAFNYDDFKILPHDPDTGLCDINAEDELVSVPYKEEDETKSGAGKGNKIYYCPGHLKIKGDFGGVTVMAQGDITHSGASTLAEGENDTLVVSGGNITLDGKSNASETHASYFAEGSFTHNGTANIFGVVVAQDKITINGGVNFTARDTGMIDILVSGHLAGWTESEFSEEDSELVALLDGDS